MMEGWSEGGGRGPRPPPPHPGNPNMHHAAAAAAAGYDQRGPYPGPNYDARNMGYHPRPPMMGPYGPGGQPPQAHMGYHPRMIPPQQQPGGPPNYAPGQPRPPPPGSFSVSPPNQMQAQGMPRPVGPPGGPPVPGDEEEEEMWKRKRQQQSTEMTIAIERARERRMAEERRRDEETKAAAAKKLRALDEKKQKKEGQSDEDLTDGDVEASPPAKFVNAMEEPHPITTPTVRPLVPLVSPDDRSAISDVIADKMVARCAAPSCRLPRQNQCPSSGCQCLLLLPLLFLREVLKAAILNRLFRAAAWANPCPSPSLHLHPLPPLHLTTPKTYRLDSKSTAVQFLPPPLTTSGSSSNSRRLCLVSG